MCTWVQGRQEQIDYIRAAEILQCEVEVQMFSGEKLLGYVAENSKSSFTLEQENDNSLIISYSDITGLRPPKD